MFSFFQTIFHKVATVIAAAAIAIGLISAPAPNVVSPQVNNQIPTIQSSNQESTEKKPIEIKNNQDLQDSAVIQENQRLKAQLEEQKLQQYLEQVKIQQEQEKKNSALNETVNHLNDLAREMDSLGKKMDEYQSSGLAAYQNVKCTSPLEIIGLLKSRGISISSKDWDINYEILTSESEQCNDKKLEAAQTYGSLYQAAKAQYDKLYSEYKQYDLLRLQLLAQ